MAVVLVIVGLLIGGLLTPLGMQLDQRKSGDTQKALEDSREALIGFALRNGYLPCPATSADNGLEDRTGAACTGGRRVGFLPWATLGLPKLDSWGHLFHYSVTPAFANSAVLFTLNTGRDITIGTRDAAGVVVPASAPNDIPALVLSHGKNGQGGSSDEGIVARNGSASNVDEQLNANSVGTFFMTRVPNDNAGAPGGEFDDQVTWVSPNILYNRMVAAQRLPN